MQRGFSSPRQSLSLRKSWKRGRSFFSRRTMSLGPTLPPRYITLSARCPESARDFFCSIPGLAFTPRRGESRGAQTGSEPRAAAQGPRSHCRSPEEGLAACAGHREPVIGGDKSCPQDTWAFSFLIFKIFFSFFFPFLPSPPPLFLSQKQKKTKETRFQFPKK